VTHAVCACDAQRRLWLVSVAGQQLSGATLPTLVRAVHLLPATPTPTQLAERWGLAQLPCFYTSPAHDELLTSAPVSYLIRTSTTSTDSLVLVVRDATGVLRRMLIKQLGPNSWQSGTNAPSPVPFAEFLRSLLPPLALPLNDPARVAAAAAAAAPAGQAAATLEKRAESFRSSRRALTTTDSTAPASPTPTQHQHPLLAQQQAAAPRRGRFNGSESNVYLSVSAALMFAKENADAVRDGTVWVGVARKEALAQVDAKHNDIDGASLASETYYFYDLDTFGANALLASMPPGSFLVRLNSTMTQFVLSLARAGGQVGHVLLVHDAARRTIQAPGGLAYASVRELVQKTPALTAPLVRAAVDCEFVDCPIELRARPLGMGVGGEVLRGRLLLGGAGAALDVAVKRLVVSSGDGGASDEAEAMLKVPPHPHVARLFGLVLKPLSLVVEFCDGGSLDQLLGIETDAPGTVLPMPDCVQLALGIARGVAHLHEARIVHRDLASRNILIARPLVPKVSDFGMSRVLRADELEVSEKASRGPIKWQAPEQLRGATRVHSYKTDVFSFAVLLTELVNNALPWSAVSNKEAAVLVAVHAKRTPIGPRATPHLRAVIQQCWTQSAAERPTMARVVELLANPTGHYDTSLNLEQSHTSHYDDVM
jgi:serine/threonine protein kinase